MKRKAMAQTLLVLAICGGISTTVFADEKDIRHGTVDRKFDGLKLDAGATFSVFDTDLDGVNHELFTSFDIVASLPTFSGQWLLYVEGNTSPRSGGISEVLGEANADVGSALDRDGEGRFQVSEFHYSWYGPGGTLVSGLIDVAGFIDSSEVANDETGQFISGSFVNNPTIAIPDYTLGLAYHKEAGADTGFTAVLVSSHGLGDNEDASYAELFKIGDGDKGVFAAVEGYWLLGNMTARLGVWGSSADDTVLDQQEKSRHNYGLYGVLDGKQEGYNWNIRAGIADDKVSTAARFLSAAVEMPLAENTLGLALAQTWVASEMAVYGQMEDTLQGEVYYRLTVNQRFELTANVQYIDHSGFDGGQDGALVYGLRLGWVY